MTNIKYVVLSDLHIGAENSLMTNLYPDTYETDPSRPSPVMIQMVNCLREVVAKSGTKPTLVLNGDIMELSLTSTHKAAMSFQRLIELLMPAGEENLFSDEILFIPGNHDHNLWETSRFNAYLDLIKEDDPTKNKNILPELHATRMFTPETIKTSFLSDLIHNYPHLKHMRVNTMYPAFAVQHKNISRCVIFSHAHFVESMYQLLSTMDCMIFPDRFPPQTLAELEKRNFAWIDFFWSVLGRSGIVGKDVSLMYDKMQSPKQIEDMVDRFSENLVGDNGNFIVKWIEKEVLEDLLNFAFQKMAASERNQNGYLTPGTLEGLQKYMEVQILKQLEMELNGMIPENITFIFGHTHKPFAKDMKFKGYHGWVNVYNSGGWVVDTTTQMPYHGGAAIFVDEDLNTASLQFYKEGSFIFEVEESMNDSVTGHNDLYNWLSTSFDFSFSPWTDFQRIAEDEVKLRHKYLKEIIKTE